jgi:MoxR-like ATPase
MSLEQFFRMGQDPHDGIDRLPDPPPWRGFAKPGKEAPEKEQIRGAKFRATPEIIEMVNAALILRRPLLVTGKPGTGKSSLAYAVAHQLKLGKVLVWPITTRATLQQGLYSYDAIARLQDASLAQYHRSDPEAQALDTRDIGRYIRLGPLGTSMLGSASVNGKIRPRVLLIDEIDKSDIDLPNDLLHIFEEAEFEIAELARLPKEARFRKVALLPSDSDEPVWIERGRVRCTTFPFVVLTSNEEREFPPAFLRRCLRLDIKPPTPGELVSIVLDHIEGAKPWTAEMEELKRDYLERRDEKSQEVATDQLLNAIFLVVSGLDVARQEVLRSALLRSLSGTR